MLAPTPAQITTGVIPGTTIVLTGHASPFLFPKQDKYDKDIISILE
jgi:hypothetical protein